MSLEEEGLGLAGKIVAAAKDFPLWILIGLALAADILLFFPRAGQMPSAFASWLWVAAVVCNVLAIMKIVSVGHHAWLTARESAAVKRTFFMTPIDNQCVWSMTKQSDDSTTTQINAHFLVKNLTAAPIRLVAPRLIRPRIEGEVLHRDVMVRAADSNLYGTAVHSGHTIPPHEALPASIALIVRGVPQRAGDQTLNVTLGVTNDEGYEQRIRVALRGFPKPKQPGAVSLEAVSGIKEPVARDVVAVLQSESNRYSKCGRERGGLGSVHIVYRGRQLMGVGGGDGWNPDSPWDQNLAEDPGAATLRSDNLDSLMAIHSQLSTDAERAQFVTALTDRLNNKIGYLSVAYFIVCGLWKVGHFKEALHHAKAHLPVAENKVFGLSNVLFLLNGLLRYRYPDFTPEMIDDIEGFIHGLQEHTFQIAEKISSIRALRLRSPMTPAITEFNPPPRG